MAEVSTREILKQFDQDQILIQDKMPELLEKYPESWVVAYGGKIISQHPELTVALKKARSKHNSKNLAVVFITGTPSTFIL